MSTGMIEIMKIAAKDAIENGKPCDLRFGTVTSISPLKVQVTSDLILPESVLVVPKHLTDYSVDVNMGVTPGTTDASNISISVLEETLIISTAVTVEENDGEVTTGEVIEGVDERTMTVYNSLAVGDKVVLLRNQGGKTYYILDRV